MGIVDDRYYWGRTAYHWAKSTLVIGMGNKPERVEATGNWSKISTALTRKGTHSWVKKDKHWVLVAPKDARFRPQGENRHEKELDISRHASEFRAGNCGEHAAVAYSYLWEHAGGSELGLVSRVNCKKPGDHAFIVIGRDPNGDGSVASWGPESLVIDPWGDLICKGTDVANVTCSYFEGDETAVHRMQDYISHYGAFVVCEFEV